MRPGARLCRSPGTSASSACAAPRRAARSAPYARRRTARLFPRVCRCSAMMPRRVLHRHLIAGERNHAGAARAMQIIKRGAPQRRRFGQIERAHGRTSVADADSVREMPPLSSTLRDSPRPPGLSRRTDAAYSFGGRPECPPAAFQSALAPAVLLPESFRGGCSFGAAAPEPSGAASPAGVHTAMLM